MKKMFAMLVLLAVGAGLFAQESPPPALTINGSVNAMVRFSTYVSNAVFPTKGNKFDFDLGDLGPVNFMGLSGRYDAGNYGAQFGLGFTPADPGFAAPPSDVLAINNAFAWAYFLDKKIHVRAGKVEEFNWTDWNVWSPNYRRLSWAIGFTPIEGLQFNVYGDIPNPSITDAYDPESYFRNIDVGVYYTSAPFDFMLVFDDSSSTNWRAASITAPSVPTPASADVFFQFKLKSVQNLKFSIESKFRSLNDFDAFSNITGIIAGYQISPALAAQVVIQLGNGDFSFFDGEAIAIGKDPVSGDIDFTAAVKPQVSYVISDAFKFIFDMAFSVPRISDAGKFNMAFEPWLQWTVAPGFFGPAAQFQFRYRLEVYNDTSDYIGNGSENIAHQIKFLLGWSF
ncbi:MAG: hypothetical protein LBC88_10100 [Spirochaetaceae bacterium]|jgi:hypothetical protein|nr:hypothetical protein [Spirochaetaceae bacterium]